jgi:hypothetical protein
MAAYIGIGTVWPRRWWKVAEQHVVKGEKFILCIMSSPGSHPSLFIYC